MFLDPSLAKSRAEPALDQQIADMAARLAAWQRGPLSEESTLGYCRDESAAAHLDATAGPRAWRDAAEPLSGLLAHLRELGLGTRHGFISIERCVWPLRNRPWLPRSITSSPADSPCLMISRAPSVS